MSTSQDATRPRRMDSDARREQLLAAGLDLFSSTPYDHVSVDDIAAATGSSRGLLYHYFGSKRGFYIEVLEASAAELVEVLRPDPDVDPMAALANGLRRALQWIREHEAGYLAVLSGGIGTDPEVAAVVERVRTAIGDLVLANIEVAPAARTLAHAHVRGWVGYVEGLLPRLLDGDLGEEDLLDLAITTLFAWFETSEAADGIIVPATDS